MQKLEWENRVRNIVHGVPVVNPGWIGPAVRITHDEKLASRGHYGSRIEFDMVLKFGMRGSCEAERMDSAREDFIRSLKYELFKEVMPAAHEALQACRYGSQSETEQAIAALLQLMDGR